MTKDKDQAAKAIPETELLHLLQSHDHEEAISVKRRTVISKKDLHALLDRSALYEKWSGTGKSGETDICVFLHWWVWWDRHLCLPPLVSLVRQTSVSSSTGKSGETDICVFLRTENLRNHQDTWWNDKTHSKLMPFENWGFLLVWSLTCHSHSQF